MPNGQLVIVTTEGHGGGAPLVAPYVVHEADPAKAEETTRKVLGVTPGEKVEAKWPIHESSLPADMREGEVRPF